MELAREEAVAQYHDQCAENDLTGPEIILKLADSNEEWRLLAIERVFLLIQKLNPKETASASDPRLLAYQQRLECEVEQRDEALNGYAEICDDESKLDAYSGTPITLITPNKFK